MTTQTIDPTEAPWTKHERPARLWAHPSFARFLASHADPLADELAAYRAAVAALAGLEARHAELSAHDRALRAALADAAPEAAERLIRDNLAAHVELDTMPERMAAAERRHAETRAAFLSAMERIARQEAQALVDGVAEPRAALAENTRRLSAIGDTFPATIARRAALHAERGALLPGVAATQSTARALLDVAAQAKHWNGATR